MCVVTVFSISLQFGPSGVFPPSLYQRKLLSHIGYSTLTDTPPHTRTHTHTHSQPSPLDQANSVVDLHITSQCNYPYLCQCQRELPWRHHVYLCLTSISYCRQNQEPPRNVAASREYLSISSLTTRLHSLYVD